LRYLDQHIIRDLKQKMVFLAGPRQVGKTTIALNLLGGDETHPGYFNWDSVAKRNLLLKEQLPSKQVLIVLDEIHKYRNWRNLIKGLYDTNKSQREFLVTGSARLDIYRKGGDSLQGRYHFWRLHPFTLPELRKTHGSEISIDQLLAFGGFPEPLFANSPTHWRRWQKERITRVMQEDVSGVEQVKNLDQLDLLASILPERVGSPLSINNLAKDLSVAHATMEHWVSILENLYVCYRIAPFGVKKLQTMRKEKKLYLWDWSLCGDPGSKFENFVASHLLKFCHYHEDANGHQMQLCFLRDKEQRELDFVVVKDRKPLFAVECKTGEGNLSKPIRYFSERTNIPAFYQVHLGTQDVEISGSKARILPFETFCRELSLI
jgi:uncharacterized protein